MTPKQLRASIVVGILLMAACGASAQVNDLCTNATSIAFPSFTSGNNVGATTSSGLTGCNIGADVWYAFSAPYTGTAYASTCPADGGTANFDTVITVWSWYPQISCTPGSGLIACNDDSCSNNRSSTLFPIVYGHFYFIAVGGYFGATGTFTLAVAGTASVPPNDGCTGAVPISIGSPVTQDNVGATTGPDPVPPCGSMAKDVWYSFVAPSCSTFTLTTCGNAAFDTEIAVWQGACGFLTHVACNDDSCGVQSTVSFFGVTGSTYYISVGGYSSASGGFTISVTASAPPPMSLAFTNNGPGTIGYSIAHGPVNGFAFTALTLNHGAFPSGWFYGIDISIPDLVSQWNTGAPFLIPVGPPCDSATVGPFGGLPPGLTVYGTSLGLPSGGTFIPIAFTTPASGTVP